MYNYRTQIYKNLCIGFYGRLQSLQWTIAKLAMDGCKACNGRLQSLQWAIVKIPMGDCKACNGRL